MEALSPEEAERLAEDERADAAATLIQARYRGNKSRTPRPSRAAQGNRRSVLLDSSSEEEEDDEDTGRGVKWEPPPSSLWCCTVNTPPRKRSLQLMLHPAFDSAVLLVIVLNSVAMALEDPLEDPNRPSALTQRLHAAELLFNVLFTIEMLIKIVAMGFWSRAGTYMRSGWNVMDFIIVTTSWLPYLVPGDSTNAAGLRSFRLLRPLRSISRFPGLRVLVETILSAIPQLGNIMLLATMYFLTFGIVGVQLWRGLFHHRCGSLQLEQPACNTSVGFDLLPDSCFAVDAEDERAEGVGDAGFCVLDPELMSLATDAEIVEMHRASGCDEDQRCIYFDVNPYWDLCSWDHMGHAFIIIYQIVTITSWQEYMYMTQDTASFGVWTYFVVSTLIGAYFLFNLFVAVLKEKFDALADEQHDDSRSDSEDEDDDEYPTVLVEFEEGRLYSLECPLQDMHAPETCRDLKVRLSKDRYFCDHLQHMTESARSNALVNPPTGDASERVLCFKGVPIPDDMSLTEAGVAPDDLVRVETSALRLRMKYFVQHGSFTAFFTALIVINTVVLASDHHLMDPNLEKLLGNVNYVLTLSFTFEVMFKLLAYTPGEFGDDAFNLFDFVIVAAGLLELLSSNDDQGSSSGAFRAFRIFRLFRVLRVLRLINFLKPLKKIGRVVVRTLGHLSYILSLLMLFTYIFTILGMQAFGGALEVDGEVPRANYDSFLDSLFTVFQVLTFDAWNGPLYDAMRVKGAFASTFFVVWILLGAFVLLNLLLVIILDSYVEVAEEMKEEELRAFIGRGLDEDHQKRFVPEGEQRPQTDAADDTFANPMSAYLSEDEIRATIKTAADGDEFLGKEKIEACAQKLRLEATDEKLAEMLMDGGDKAKINTDGFVDWAIEELRKRQGRMRSEMEGVAQAGIEQLQLEMDQRASGTPRADTGRSGGSSPRTPREWTEEEMATIDNKAYGCFAIDNPVRKACFTMSLSKKMDQFILTMILFNCFVMALDNPYLKEGEPLKAFVNVMDIVFTFIFLGEMLIKSIAFGFARNGPSSYLNDSWNRLDFTIVVISIVDFVLTHIARVEGDHSVVKVFRAIRCVRPLRMLTKMKGLQMLVNSLLASVTSLANVFLMTMICWLIFGILGINLFCGQFWRCTDPSVYGKFDCVGAFSDDQSTELLLRRWENPESNFDNIGQSMFALYEIMTLDEWIFVAYNGIDSVAVHKQPQDNHYKPLVFYFLGFIIICNFLFLNLFIGVIYEEYVALKNEGLRALTAGQKAWYNVQMAVSHSKPSVRATLAKGHSGGIREKIYKTVTASWFDHFIMVTIMVNCVVMAMSFHGEPSWYTSMTNLLNYIFTLIFTVEAGLKIYALSFSGYWLEPWNRFDFTIVVACLLDVLVSDILQVKGLPTSVFRLFRIGRVIGRVARMFRVIKEVQSLNQIFQTLIESLPALFYMGVLVILIIFIFSILGMHFFGHLKHGEVIGPNANFES